MCDQLKRKKPFEYEGNGERERERAKFPRIERLLFLRKITDQSNGS